MNEPMPTFAGETLDGARVDLADDAGKPLVVNAWASWCYPCREEQPMLQQDEIREPVEADDVSLDDTDEVGEVLTALRVLAGRVGSPVVRTCREEA